MSSKALLTPRVTIATLTLLTTSWVLQSKMESTRPFRNRTERKLIEPTIFFKILEQRTIPQPSGDSLAEALVSTATRPRARPPLPHITARAIAIAMVPPMTQNPRPLPKIPTREIAPNFHTLVQGVTVAWQPLLSKTRSQMDPRLLLVALTRTLTKRPWSLHLRLVKEMWTI